MRGLICHYELRLVPESRPCLSEPDSMIRAGRDRGWCFHRRSHLLEAGDGVKVKSQGAISSFSTHLVAISSTVG